ALEGLVYPPTRQPVLLERVLGDVQGLLVVNAHADPLTGRLVLRGLYRQAVLGPLFEPAHVELVLVLIADYEAQDLGVELAAFGQVARSQDRVARTQEPKW